MEHSGLAVGGPLELPFSVLSSTATKIVCDGYPGMAYHWTLPTDTNWRETYDHDWFMHGTPEPIPPAHVWEWHEADWVSPEVALIRGAVLEASERFR